MKRVINADSMQKVTNSDLVKLLNSHGIDTTIGNYELYAEEYERYGNGRYYKKTFKCSGDYLAYVSMLVHEAPTAEAIESYFDSLEDFEAYVLNPYPTLAAIKKHASRSWYGNGDDTILYLRNTDTGKYLYQYDDGQSNGNFII